jgi:hypothetical protein
MKSMNAVRNVIRNGAVPREQVSAVAPAADAKLELGAARAAVETRLSPRQSVSLQTDGPTLIVCKKPIVPTGGLTLPLLDVLHRPGG